MGGAADKTPPALVVSEPENESVEVRPEFIRLTFSDYLDEPSFTQAFSITPSPRRRASIAVARSIRHHPL